MTGVLSRIRAMGWHAWTGDEAGLRSVAAHTSHVLERGPLGTTAS